QVLVLPFRRRRGSGRDRPQGRLSLRGTPALRQLSPQAPRHSPPAPLVPVPQAELLLRSRRMPPAPHASVSALPRSHVLSRSRRHPHQRHAAGALASTGPRAGRSLRRRPPDHRPLVGLLAPTLSPDPVLEDRPCPPGGPGRNRRPAVRPGGCLP